MAPLTPYEDGDIPSSTMVMRNSGIVGNTIEDLFEEAKLRDMLIQRRITREGLSWDALPYVVQREIDSVRDLFSTAAAGGHTQVSKLCLRALYFIF